MKHRGDNTVWANSVTVIQKRSNRGEALNLVSEMSERYHCSTTVTSTL